MVREPGLLEPLLLVVLVCGELVLLTESLNVVRVVAEGFVKVHLSQHRLTPLPVQGIMTKSVTELGRLGPGLGHPMPAGLVDEVSDLFIQVAVILAIRVPSSLKLNEVK